MPPTRDAAADRARPIAGGALVALVVFLVFAPAFTSTFGFADDFPYLGESTGQTKWQVRLETQAGRPIAGMLRSWAFGAAGTIPNLAYARLATIGIIAAMGVLLWRSLTDRGLPNAAAAALAVLVTTVPAFGIYAGWAMLVAYAPPLLLTFVAARSVSAAASRRGLSSAWRLTVSALVLLPALAMYPPSTGMLWLWYAADVLTRKERPVDQLRRFGSMLIAYAASLGLYLAIYRLAGLEHHRAELTADPLGKLTWFVQDVMPWVARLQWIPDGAAGSVSVRFVPVLVMALGVLAFLLWREAPSRTRLTALALWLATLPLAYFPLLAAAEREITERSIVALSCVVALAAGIGVWRVSRIVLGDRWASIALVALAVAGAWQQHTNTSQFVRKHRFEYDYIREAVTERGSDVTRAVLIQPAVVSPPAGVPYDEYRLLTSVHPIEYAMLGAMTALIARMAAPSQASPSCHTANLPKPHRACWCCRWIRRWSGSAASAIGPPPPDAWRVAAGPRSPSRAAPLARTCEARRPPSAGVRSRRCDRSPSRASAAGARRRDPGAARRDRFARDGRPGSRPPSCEAHVRA